MGKQRVCFLLAAVFFLIFNLVKAGSLDHWQFISTNTYTAIRTTPTGGCILLNGDDLAFGTGRWTFAYPPWTVDDFGEPFEFEPARTVVDSDLRVTAGNGGYVGGGSPWGYELPRPTTSNLCSVAFGNGVFVVSARTRSITQPNFYVCPATNTFTYDWTNNLYTMSSPWQPVVLGLPDRFQPSYGDVYPPERYFRLCYGNGLFVAVPGYIFDGIWTSTNGISWTHHNAPNEWYSSIAYGNGVFVAGGNEGGLVSSTNGVDWISSYGTAGPNWTTNGYNGGQVCFGNGVFVAVTSTPSGDILVSTNGFNWSRSTIVTNTYFDVVGYGDGTFIVCGNSSPAGRPTAMWQSDHFKNSSFNQLTRTTNGISFDLGVETTVSYKVQVSSNLIDWTDWLSFTNGSNLKTIVDTNLTAQRYYRTVAP